MTASNTWNTDTSFNQSSASLTRAYQDKVDYDVNSVYKFIFGAIAVVALVGNALVSEENASRPQVQGMKSDVCHSI